MPAATNEVATQNSASWTCQVRIRLYGKTCGEVEAEEAVDLRAVVLRGRADERLDQEQRRHHEEEPRARALRRRQRDVAGRAERQRRLLAAVPAEPTAPAAEDREQDADPAEQRDQRQHRPDDHVRGRLVVDARLGRPVVGVGVVRARAARSSRPTPSSRRTPSAARSSRAIGDRVRAQPVLASSARRRSASSTPTSRRYAAACGAVSVSVPVRSS